MELHIWIENDGVYTQDELFAILTGYGDAVRTLHSGVEFEVAE